MSLDFNVHGDLERLNFFNGFLRLQIKTQLYNSIWDISMFLAFFSIFIMLYNLNKELWIKYTSQHSSA